MINLFQYRSDFYFFFFFWVNSFNMQSILKLRANMSYFLTFAINHWILWLILLVLLIVLLLIESQGKVGGILQISAKAMVNLMNREKALVIDVRTAQAFAKGHIIHAQNIEFTGIEQAAKKIQKFKSSFVIIYDEAQGRKAIKFAKALKSSGFQQVQCLQGGLQAWRKENLPLVKDAE